MPRPKRSAAGSIASARRRTHEPRHPRRPGSPEIWRAVVPDRSSRQPASAAARLRRYAPRRAQAVWKPIRPGRIRDPTGDQIIGKRKARHRLVPPNRWREADSNSRSRKMPGVLAGVGSRSRRRFVPGDQRTAAAGRRRSRPSRAADRREAENRGVARRPCAARGWRSPTSFITMGPPGARPTPDM